MQEFATKADNVGDTLGASGFNAYITELENICKDLGFTLDPEGGPDTDLDMLGKALAMMGSGAEYYADSGSANTYVLSRVGTMQNVRAYFDGMRITFMAGNTNTGASTINVASLGSKSIVRADGSALSGGEVSALDYTRAIYRSSADRVELLDSIISGTIVQEVYVEDATASSQVIGATMPPVDNTIPQWAETYNYAALDLSITPNDPANILELEAVINGGTDLGSVIYAFFFQNGAGGALKAGGTGTVSQILDQVTIKHRVVAGSIAARTYNVNFGGSVARTVYLNSGNGTRLFGGVELSSLKITEKTP